MKFALLLGLTMLSFWLPSSISFTQVQSLIKLRKMWNGYDPIIGVPPPPPDPWPLSVSSGKPQNFLDFGVSMVVPDEEVRPVSIQVEAFETKLDSLGNRIPDVSTPSKYADLKHNKSRQVPGSESRVPGQRPTVLYRKPPAKTWVAFVYIFSGESYPTNTKNMNYDIVTLYP